jgi:lipopolysaccharide export system permease protein
MRLHERLNRYLMGEFALGYALAFGVLAFVVCTFDAVELLRRAAGREFVSMAEIAYMAFLKLPQMMETLSPFVFLFGAIGVFWRLNRSNELVVIRTGGVSAWQFLKPALVVAGVWGVLQVALFNPFAAAMYGRFTHLEAKYFEEGINQAFISTDGLWLRQKDDSGEMIVHASIVEPDFSLRGINAFIFDNQFQFKQRVDAVSARLANNAWQFSDTTVTAADGERNQLKQLSMPSNLTPSKIQESFSPPQSLSIWQLPDFIQVLENSGFATAAHRLHFQVLLTTPFVLMAMVLLAACFSITPQRQKRTLLLITGALLAGFMFYSFSNIVHALGGSGRLPAWLAAWAPFVVTALLGVTSMLHYEDG